MPAVKIHVFAVMTTTHGVWQINDARPYIISPPPGRLTTSVVRYLIDKGVNPQHLVAAGFADNYPLVDGDPEVSGYTMLPTLGGRGHSGTRSPQPYSDVLDTVCIVAIVKAAVADRLVEKLAPLIDEIVAIIAVSDVQVIRSGHF